MNLVSSLLAFPSSLQLGSLPSPDACGDSCVIPYYHLDHQDPFILLNAPLDDTRILETSQLLLLLRPNKMAELEWALWEPRVG